MMVGGETAAVDRLDPILKTLAPGLGDRCRAPGGRRASDPRAELGYIHAGPAGAGHFVKMVHNGIEYGLMQAYAEGFDILHGKASDELPEDERFELNLPDIAEVWRRGSVVSSWLLDLAAQALAGDACCEQFTGAVADSGEGRWTIQAAIEEAVPADVLSAALFARFRSRRGPHLRRQAALGHALRLRRPRRGPRDPGMTAGRRLFVSDIDGTLVTPDKQLTSAAIAAVADVRVAGVPFSVVSSRPARGMAKVVETLGVTLPYAAFNGANVVDPTGGLLRAHRLTAKAAAATLQLLQRAGVRPWVFADDAWLLTDPHGPNTERERQTVAFDPTVVRNFDAVIDRIDKIVAPSDDTSLLDRVEADLRSALAGAANVERSQAYYIDITDPLANKGEAVRTIAAQIGADLARTIVIGDMTNDVAMFRVAGFAIAMGQSPDAVKAQARAVTAANTEDGFAKAVATLVLPRFAEEAPE